MQIAENARELRAVRSLTIREVARASGLSAGAIHGIEHAKASPRISTLERLAEALGVEVHDLIEGRQGDE